MTKAIKFALPILLLWPAASVGMNLVAPQDASPSATPSSTSTAPNPAPQKKISPPENDGSTRVIRNGGTKEPTVNFTPAAPPQEVKRRTDNVNDLLTKTDANLKSLSGHTLTSTQQDTATQINVYTKQARAALADGDLDRAENLASKANVLSADLAGKP